MTRRKIFAPALAILALGLLGPMPLAIADPPDTAKPIQIGMVKTFFNDIPKVFIDIATDPFKQLLKTTTGLDGELVSQFDTFEVAQKLNDNELQFGVFHGHEFAWAKEKYPKLTPVLIALNTQHDVRGYIIVRNDSPATKIADLRGKKFAVPLATKQHCVAYLERNCTDNASADPKAFFAAVQRALTQEAAMDDVCRDKVQGAIVDTVGLEFYKQIKGPVFAKNLRVLQQSDAFPEAVIAYKQGVLSQETLDQFRNGLMKANQTPLGRDMMDMWKIDCFQAVPDGYAKRLADVLKAYPAPQSAKVSAR